MTIFLFILGLVLLIVGAEMLVRGSSRLAAVMGISPLVIGLTVVAFGTSSPELAVSFNAALNNQASIAVGNVIGSNIFNILFILGVSALITPLVVSQQLVRFDVPLMIGVSVLVLVLALDQVFSRLDGLLLFSGLVLYIGYSIYQSRRETTAVQEEYSQEFGIEKDPKSNTLVNLGLVVVGLVLLVIGSGWLVDSTVAFAQYMGISELVVGLTIVAAGTSLPEVVTSVIAALRGERDIAVGNVVGSNLFNLMGVLGLASLVSPTSIAVSTAVISFDLPVMIAVALAALPIFFTGGTISRQEGVALLAYYIAYTAYLILAVSAHDALEGFTMVMLYFVMPLTVLTMVVILVQEVRRRRNGEAVL